MGWDKSIWSAEAGDTPDDPSVQFRRSSPDGEEGYPGTVAAAARYTLTDRNELAIEMTAITDRTTIVNMVHHLYFNLAGEGDVLAHDLQLFADAFTPGMPPDGEIVPVAGTPFDFTVAKAIGRDLGAAGSPGGGAPAGARYEPTAPSRRSARGSCRILPGRLVARREGRTRLASGRARAWIARRGRLRRAESEETTLVHVSLSLPTTRRRIQRRFAS